MESTTEEIPDSKPVEETTNSGLVFDSIRKDDIYKFYVLDSTGKPIRVIIFRGKYTPPDLEVFSEIEKIQLDIDQPQIVYSTQQIHKDDSIRSIKKKLLIELGENMVSYDELYLFSKQKDNLHLLRAYQEMTNHDKNEFTKPMAGQFLMNMQILDKATVEALNHKEDDVTYTYNEFAKILQREAFFEVPIPLGRKFSQTRDLLFSVKPFDILPSSTLAYQPNQENLLLTFENHLLLTYGELTDNSIYVCLADDVLQYVINQAVDEQHMLQIYFPLLEQRDILSRADLLSQREQLIDESKQLLKEKSIKTMQIIDTFYDIYHGKTTELPYVDKGVRSFDITLHPEFKTYFPLEIIFKQLHATRQIPFIKYNPGIRREHIYRLYSIKRTKRGKKIPFLSKAQLLSLSKSTGKSRQISLVVQYAYQGQVVQFYVNLDLNGNINVRTELANVISITELQELIIMAINPILTTINTFLEVAGYKIVLFSSLQDQLLEVKSIQYEYVSTVNAQNKIQSQLNKYVLGLSSIFDVIETNLKHGKGGALLQFKRVENYTKMDAMAAMITRLFKHTNSEREIVGALMLNFALTEEEALMHIAEYWNHHTQIRGQYVNKQLDIVDNPGFPVLMHLLPFENKLVIEIKDIDSFAYIEVLDIYIDSLLRLLQDQDSTKVPASSIDKLRFKIVEDQTHVDNVIIPEGAAILKRTFSIELEDAGDEDDKGDLGAEQEDEDEDIGEGILFEEEDEVDDVADADDMDVAGYGVGPKYADVPQENLSMPPEIEPKEQEDGDVEEEESGILFEEESLESNQSNSVEEEQNKIIEQHGGAKLFYNKMKKLEPTLFLSKKEGHYNAYVRACPANYSRQPIILTDEEKAQIDRDYPGSYDVALPYGTKKDKKYWYMCPRYWCLKSNRPMTEDQLINGECNGITEVDGVNVYEFTDQKEHKNKDGNYRQHYPGFLPPDSHPSHCLPCCFKKMNSQQQITRRRECGIPDGDLDGPDRNVIENLITPENLMKQQPKKAATDTEPPAKRGILETIQDAASDLFRMSPMKSEVEMETKTEAEAAKTRRPGRPRGTNKQKQTQSQTRGEDKSQGPKQIAYVVNFDKYPIPKFRWGFLPLSVELFLHTDNSASITKKNPALIRPDERPLLRYGVETSRHQSFIACLADIYTYHNREPVPSIKEMRAKIINALSLDLYLRAHNGSLVAVFQPKRRIATDTDLEKYVSTDFYKSFTDLSNPAQNNFLKDTIDSFENFLRFLNDDDSFIDHTYLWDIISSGELGIFGGPLNIVIMEIEDNDVTDNISLLCPTNSFKSKIYDPEHGTIILLKHEDYYEPIYSYGNINRIRMTEDTHQNAIKIFTKSNIPANLKKTFSMIRRTAGKYCSAKSNPNRIRQYMFKENIHATEIYAILKEHEYRIESQVMNYRGKIIAFMVADSAEDPSPIYVPTYPSAALPNLPTIFIDAVQWRNYADSRDKLTQISLRTDGKIRCKPTHRVVEDEIIVGLLTETNQFIQLDPPTEPNTVEDNLNVPEAQIRISNYADYYATDKALAVGTTYDMKRVETIQNISLESHFYITFRNKIRQLLNEYKNKEIRQTLIDLLENSSYLFQVKLKKVEILLKWLTRHAVSFDEFTPEVIQSLRQITTLVTDKDTKSFCLSKKDMICIPKLNLMNGKENETYYFARMADELIRYTRIRLFMLEPNKFLNITSMDYKVNPDEIILLHSVLHGGDYFDDLIPFDMNEYIQNIPYDMANPARMKQNYSNTVPLEEQDTLTTKTSGYQAFDKECINRTGEVLDTWKAKFPPQAKETILYNSPLCSFYGILYVLKKHAGMDESIDSIKQRLWSIYNEYLPNHRIAIYDILSKQGKSAMITKIKQGEMDFETMIMLENYYLTNLDLWLFASKMGLPIVIFTEDKLSNLRLEANSLVLSGEKDRDRFYFMRSTDDGYNLITPSVLLSEISLDNNMYPTFDEFIKNYKMTIRRPARKPVSTSTVTSVAEPATAIHFKTEPMPV